MRIYRGVVEDNNSPLKDGKVRVRILGIHTEDKNLIKTEELPWAEVMGSLSGSGIGLTSIPVQGTWVFLFLDNDDENKPIIMGTMCGKSTEMPDTNIGFCDGDGNLPKSDRLNEYDTNRLTRVENLDKTIHNEINNSDLVCAGFDMPKSTSDMSVYPNNVVYEDDSGNVVEIDSTDGNERFRIYHGKSKTRIEIDKDGYIVTSTTKNLWNKIKGLFSLQAKENIIIEGDIKIIGNIQVTGKITSGDNITSSGEIADLKGNLSSLRDAYDGHNHVQNNGNHHGGGATTAIPTSTDPLTRVSEFKWSGSPL
jgi:hypothetical protein